MKDIENEYSEPYWNVPNKAMGDLSSLFYVIFKYLTLYKVAGIVRIARGNSEGDL